MCKGRSLMYTGPAPWGINYLATPPYFHLYHVKHTLQFQVNAFYPRPDLALRVLHQPRLWFITGGYLVKRWFIPAAARARGQSNDLNREILASNLFNCHTEVINAPPVPSISRCIHIVYRHKNVWEYQWSNFIYNCMSTFLHYVRCKDALLDCSAPGGERCESLTWVDEIVVVCVCQCVCPWVFHVSTLRFSMWKLITCTS